MNKLTIVFLLVGLGLQFAAAAGVTLHVSRDGNDTWSGRLAAPNKAKTDGPFASLQRARDELRKLRGKGSLPQGATVLIRQGTYHLAEPLALGPEDSGAEKAEIVFAAYPGEKVSLKGSVPITSWQRYRGNIYQAPVPDAALRGGRFWHLFYQGRRQVLARYPNADPQHPRSGGFVYIAGVVEKGSKTLLQYNPARVDPSKWPKPQELRVHVWSWLNWNRNICSIQTIDPGKHVITLAQPASYMLSEGNRFFIENALDELDAPGEWYLDSQAKQLYFWPPDNADPKESVSVPVLPTLISLKGDPASQKFMSHVRFSHLNLAETNDTLVVMSGTAYCTVAGCTLTNCGGTGLQITDRGHHNSVLGCDIAHVGGEALTLSDTVDWTHNLEHHLAYNTISNNHVHDVGEGGNAWGAIMINPGCGGNASHDNVISHNLIHDTPRQGITFNGFRNIVEYNHVHHTNQEQSDTGAIGMGSRDIYERGSIVRYNYVHDPGGYNMLKPGVWEYPHYCWGVYLDDYTSGVHVYGNLIVRTYLGGVMVHGGQDNVIENNIIVDGTAQQVQYAPIDSLVYGRTPGHPDKSEWLMKGTKLLGNILSYTGPKAHYVVGGKWQQVLAESDRNLIWHGGQPLTTNLPGVADGNYWAAWQKLGYDAHSVIADPRFVNPAKDDYRLRPDSPALKLGFKPLPLEKIGLYKSPDRASWPVADDQWRETHLTHPEGEPPAAPKPARTQVPGLRAARRATPPVIDGNVDTPEWDWGAPGVIVTVAALSLEDGMGKQPSYAFVTFDREALYVALVNKVSDSGKLLKGGGTWGADDGAEICIQDISGPKPGPIFVVQGYPSGRCESVDHAGAPADAVARLGRAVQYAAGTSPGQWSGEWKIPFTALGANPDKTTSLLFNIGVLKAEEKEWIAWVSTGAAPWRMELAGKLLLGGDGK